MVGWGGVEAIPRKIWYLETAPPSVGCWGSTRWYLETFPPSKGCWRRSKIQCPRFHDPRVKNQKIIINNIEHTYILIDYTNSLSYFQSPSVTATTCLNSHALINFMKISQTSPKLDVPQTLGLSRIPHVRTWGLGRWWGIDAYWPSSGKRLMFILHDMQFCVLNPLPHVYFSDPSGKSRESWELCLSANIQFLQVLNVFWGLGICQKAFDKLYWRRHNHK